MLVVTVQIAEAEAHQVEQGHPQDILHPGNRGQGAVVDKAEHPQREIEV